MCIILALFALSVAAGPAAAQHCWPASIALMVRDARGGALHPQRIDSLEYSPDPSPRADFGVGALRITPGDTQLRNGPLPVVIWHGRGACRVDIAEVVISGAGRVMRLWMDLHVNSLDRPGPSQFLLATPPLGDGTWRLDVCRLPAGRVNVHTQIPGRWVRVSTSGDPGTPPKGPQGCDAGTPPR